MSFRLAAFEVAQPVPDSAFTRATKSIIAPGAMAAAASARTPSMVLPRNETVPPAMSPAPSNIRVKLSILSLLRSSCDNSDSSDQPAKWAFCSSLLGTLRSLIAADSALYTKTRRKEKKFP